MRCGVAGGGVWASMWLAARRMSRDEDRYRPKRIFHFLSLCLNVRAVRLKL